MPVLRRLSAALVALALCLSASAHAPAPLPRKERALALPVGRWVVRFENGVVETCEIRKDGGIRVVEPYRNSGGKATLRGRAVVLECEDDRAERWTRVEGKMVVEHWFPTSAFPHGTPVRGVAEREK